MAFVTLRPSPLRCICERLPPYPQQIAARSAMALSLRLRLPDGSASTLRMEREQTWGELLQHASDAAGLAVASVQLSHGFPPRHANLPHEQPIAGILNHMDTVIVTSNAAQQQQSTAQSQGSNRRKPTQVRRILPSNAALERRSAAVSCSETPTASDAPEQGAAPSGSAGMTAAEGHSNAAATRKRKGQNVDKEPDPLAQTMRSEREAAKQGKKGLLQSRRKTSTVEELAVAYYHGPSSALQLAANAGGSSGDFLTEHGMIEHRLRALQSGGYEVAHVEGKVPQLAVTFRGARKMVSETVRHLDVDELRAFVVAVASRGTSRRGCSTHLLSTREMATRSPALFWSFAHYFDGSVEGGLKQLLGQAAE